MLEEFKKLIEDAGGYVNPKLQLLVGDEAEHGLVSLAGVPDDELSLRVPLSLEEPRRSPGPWIAFLTELGYEIDDTFWPRHFFTSGVLPVIGAANHNQQGGKLLVKNDDIELYGIDFSYTKSKARLQSQWGIHE